MFYENVTKLCEERELKLTPILDSLGIGKGATTNWKKGSTPNGETLLKLAKYFNVTTDFLLTGEENPNYINTVGLISGNENVVSNHGPIIKNGSERRLSDDIAELLRIAEYLEPKCRHRLLSFAFELEEEQQNKGAASSNET